MMMHEKVFGFAAISLLLVAILGVMRSDWQKAAELLLLAILSGMFWLYTRRARKMRGDDS